MINEDQCTYLAYFSAVLVRSTETRWSVKSEPGKGWDMLRCCMLRYAETPDPMNKEESSRLSFPISLTTSETLSSQECCLLSDSIHCPCTTWPTVLPKSPRRFRSTEALSSSRKCWQNAPVSPRSHGATGLNRIKIFIKSTVWSCKVVNTSGVIVSDMFLKVWCCFPAVFHSFYRFLSECPWFTTRPGAEPLLWDCLVQVA